MTTFLRLALIAVTAAPMSLSAQTPGKSAADVASALQRKYDSIRDFSADFTHQHQSGVLKRKIVEQGSLLVKKPGKMRWEYKSPEKKLFVSDGNRIYFHDPAINQVTITEMPKDDKAASAALFLIGKGNLTRDFNASFLESSAAADTYALQLQPKTPQPEYDWLEIVVDRQTLLIQTLTAAEKDGGRSTFQFSRFKENIGVGDKPFEFEIPRGAEVIHAGRAKF